MGASALASVSRRPSQPFSRTFQIVHGNATEPRFVFNRREDFLTRFDEAAKSSLLVALGE